jgi:hypothetical protein
MARTQSERTVQRERLDAEALRQTFHVRMTALLKAQTDDDYRERERELRRALFSEWRMSAFLIRDLLRRLREAFDARDAEERRRFAEREARQLAERQAIDRRAAELEGGRAGGVS